MNVEIEICVYSIESCLNAESACASRAELCASPQEGGITPSISLISAARNLLNKTGLFVMIRPRGGDFLYTKEELEIIELILFKDKGYRLGVGGLHSVDRPYLYKINKTLKEQ